MKKTLVMAVIALLTLAPNATQAQLGGLGKLGAKVTAESLSGDVTCGMDFFLEAAVYYTSAVFPKSEAAIKAKDFADLKGKSDSAAFATLTTGIADQADKIAKEGKKLDADAKEAIKKGDAEFAKGVAKWAVLAGSIAMAAKDGKPDAALAAAIPVAQQAVKDLPQIKKMSDAMKALKKIK